MIFSLRSGHYYVAVARIKNPTHTLRPFFSKNIRVKMLAPANERTDSGFLFSFFFDTTRENFLMLLITITTGKQMLENFCF